MNLAAPRRARLLLAVFAACLVHAPADAQANPQRRGPDAAIVDLTLEGCPDIDGTRVRELVAIEIATIRAGGQPGPTAARLTCDGPHVRIDLLGDAPSGADIDLAGTPAPARPRLLALTITELAAASWVDPRKQIVAQPAPQPQPSAAVVVATAAPPPAPPRARVFVATSLRRIGSPATWLGGAGFGVEYSVRSWLAAAVDVRLEAGETSTATAPIGWRAVSSMAGVAIGGARGRLAWSALPGLSAGIVRLSAAPVPAGAVSTSLDAMWAGPSLMTRLRVAIARAAFVHVELGGGFVTHKVVGLLNDDTTLLRIDGPWAIVAAGAGLAFH